MPKRPETDTLSAGYPRQSGGSDIDCGVDVSIVNCAAVRARPFSIGKRQRMAGCPALTTAFGGREKAINLDQLSAVPQSLIGQYSDKITPSGIGNGLRQTMVLNQTLHIEIFDADRLVFADQSNAEGMEGIAPGITYRRIGPSGLNLCLSSVLRSFLLLRQSPLFPSQLFLTLGKMLRVCDFFSRAENGQILQAEINPNPNLTTTSHLLDLRDDATGDVPAAIGIVAHGDCRRVGRKVPRPHHLQRLGHLRERQHLISIIKAGLGEFSGLASVFPAETRIFRSLAKEVPISRVEMTKRLLQRNARHFVKPCERRVFFKGRKHRVGLNEPAFFFAFRPYGLSQRSSAIVDDTHTAKRPVQESSLIRRRVETKLVGTLDGVHAFYVPAVSRLVKSVRPMAGPQFLPALKGRVSLRGFR